MNSLFKITYPEFFPKGWGYEMWLTNGEKYCGKLLHFHPNRRCSFHYHKIKHEHFYVSKGLFQILLAKDDESCFDLNRCESKFLKVGMVLEIPTGLRHQMIALEESEIIEISTQHFENDSYRVIKGD